MEDIKKTCTKCGDNKLLEEFYKQKNGKYNRSSKCKSCINNENKKKPSNYYKLNPEKRKLSSKKHYEKNKDHYRNYGRRRYKENKEFFNQYSKEYYQKNKIKSNEYGKVWRKNNKEKCREYARNRYKKNLELASIKWMRNFLYRTEKLGFNSEFLNTVMEFGYTPRQLILRIECQFKEGMSWSNRKDWHIDHKKPISLFKEGTSPKTINMLSNLQPIWKKDNLSKGNKF